MNGTEKQEMWFLDLAKSKIIMAASKSCELVIFFGTLWLTLVTIVPGAEGWANGIVNTVFMAVLGFAVDAAMPESFLHVVLQYLEEKRNQLKWSIPLAIAMFALVVANVLYSKLDPAGNMTWLINTLLILRMIIGICYVSVRECQNLIDRHHPTFPRATIEEKFEHIEALIAQQVAQFEQQITDQIAHVTAQITAQIGQMNTSFAAQIEQQINGQSDQLGVQIGAQGAHFLRSIEHSEQRLKQVVASLSINFDQQLNSAQSAQSVTVAPAQPEVKQLSSPRNSKKVLPFPGPDEQTEQGVSRIIQVITEHPEQSDRALGRQAGCAPGTIKRYREQVLSERSIEQV